MQYQGWGADRGEKEGEAQRKCTVVVRQYQSASENSHGTGTPFDPTVNMLPVTGYRDYRLHVTWSQKSAKLSGNWSDLVPYAGRLYSSAQCIVKPSHADRLSCFVGTAPGARVKEDCIWYYHRVHSRPRP